jgi:filamentous hemagglutinin family protein
LGASALSALLLFGQSAPLLANPTGGAVVAGAATIGAAGKTLTINQSTNNAIINWQTFSIASGETTKFLVPNSSSATLNYVLSGNPSAIYGTLSSNGRLFLVNPSGILVGSGGQINTASFIGSTLNANNSEFLSGGNLQFSGSSNASIVNEGSINASSGNVYLIASQVTNQGSITAAQGEVGLAAGSSVLLAQDGDQHLFVQSNPIGTTRAVGVTNAGTIRAENAELRAAGGNAYALAINNTGSIAATGYKKVGGQVYLTADTGEVSNSGTIDASSSAAGGHGGTVLLKSTEGQAVNSGLIAAKGGTSGTGGEVEVSGATVDVASGTVDTLAASGQAGTFTIDPATWTVAASGGDETGAQVSGQLSLSNVTLNADTTVTINDTITWSTPHILTLSTNTSGSTVAINAPISGTDGVLQIDTAGSTDPITTGANGSVSVGSFILQSGSWNQNSATLPGFTATNNFQILNSASFLRVTGGNGSTGNPYQITDIYGLQGLASPSKAYLTSSAVLENNIDASVTANWNSNAGWTPIGSYDGEDSSDGNAYSGTFNGQGYTISNLTIDAPSSGFTGLFGDTANTSAVENLNLTGVNVIGNEYAGGLVGVNNATILNCTSAGSVTGNYYVGGLLGINGGTVSGSSSSGTVIGNADGGEIGGLVGESQIGLITNCSSSANVLAGAANNTAFVGGLIGLNLVSVDNSSASGTVTGQSIVGGLVGYNEGGTIVGSSSTSKVTGSQDIGGFVGQNTGSISLSYATGAVNGSSSVGGFAGVNNGGSIDQSYALGSTSGLNQVGGLAGANISGTISNSYSTGTVTGTQTTVGGLLGYNQSGTVINSYTASPIASTSATEVGGLVGYDSGGTYSNVFWDTSTAGVGVGVGSSANGTSGIYGATTTNLMSQSFITSTGSGTPAWNFESTWTTNRGTTLPQLPGTGGPGANTGTGGDDMLSGTVYSNAGGTLTADGVTVYLIFDGVATGTTTTDGSGAYSFDISASDLTSGVLLTDPLDKGNTLFQTSSGSSSFTDINIDGSTLSIVADPASNSALKTAAGSLSGYGVNYSVDNSNNLTTNANVNMNILSGTYTVDGNITAAGTLKVGNDATLSGTANKTLQGTSITMCGGLNDSGALVFHSTTGAVSFYGVGNSDTPAQSGGLTITAAGPAVIKNSFIEISGGNFDVTGTGYASSVDNNGNPNGIELYDTSVLLDGGSFTLNGTAGYVSPSTGVINSGSGVAIGTDGSTQVELSTTGTGDGTIIGTASQNITSQNYVQAVSIYETNPSTLNNYVSVADGLLTINGTVNHTSANGATVNGATIGGVEIASGTEVVATGSGSVAITGNTSGATTELNGGNFSFINGVQISGLVGVGSGSLTITGTAGTLNTSNSTINNASSGSDGVGSQPSSVGVLVDCSTGTSTDNILSGPGSTVNLTGTGGAVVTTGAYTGGSSGVSFDSNTVADFGTAPSAPPSAGLLEEDIVANTGASGSTVTINGTGAAVNAGNGSNSRDAGSTGVKFGGTSITVEDGGSLAVTGTGGAVNATNTSGQTGDKYASSQGIRISDGAVIAAVGSSSLSFSGRGGTITSGANKAVSSIGVNIGNDEGTVSITTQNGTLTFTGEGGTSPNLGAGVILHATSGAQVVISSDSTVQITGTGGAGYTGNGTIVGDSIPNAGVILAGDNSITGGTVNLSGTGGTNSEGVMVVNLTGDSVLDSDPVSSSFTATNLTVTSLGGGVVVDAGIDTSNQLTITSPTTLTVLGTGGTSITTQDLTFTAPSLVTVDTSIAGNGTMNIYSIDSNVVLGPDAVLSDNGTTVLEDESTVPNVLTIAAGSGRTSPGYFINQSSSAGDAISVTGGAVYYIFSTSPTGDVYNGINVDPTNVIFNAPFPDNTPPAGNGELYYGATGSIPVNLLDLAEMEDGSGSNLVPVSTVPQQGEVSGAGGGSGGSSAPGAGYSGGQSSQNGSGNGGLANASGNGGLIVSGDLGQLSGGQLNNVQGALVNGAFSVALGAGTYLNLSEALGLLDGGYYPDDAKDNDNGPGKGPGGGNPSATILPGQCFEISNGQVTPVQKGQTPDPIKNALSNNVLNSMPGH